MSPSVPVPRLRGRRGPQGTPRLSVPGTVLAPGLVATRPWGQEGNVGRGRCSSAGAGRDRRDLPGRKAPPWGLGTREGRGRAAEPTGSRKCFTNNKPQLLLIDRNSTNFKFSRILLFSETPKKAPLSGSYIVNSCREKKDALGASRAPQPGLRPAADPAPRLQAGGTSLRSQPRAQAWLAAAGRYRAARSPSANRSPSSPGAGQTLTIIAFTISLLLFFRARTAFARDTFACDITSSMSFTSTPVSST